MDSQVWLLCGYRRTGKDTLFNRLIAIDDRPWRGYQHPNSIRADPFAETKSGPFTRVAFADALKREAREVYGIPNLDSMDKDGAELIHYQTGAKVSPRDIYIEWGQIRRDQDPEYWCKRAFQEALPGSKIIVTDWRFSNEGLVTRTLFPNALSVRVYRASVPEPPMDIASEHDLDGETTDLLMVPTVEDFEAARKRFPQYAEYVFTGMI